MPGTVRRPQAGRRAPTLTTAPAVENRYSMGMPRPTSNRDRIARMAEEAAAAKKLKEEKQKAAPVRKPRASTKRAVAGPPRMKLVWTVYDVASRVVKTFAYADKAAAEAEAARLTESKNVAHTVRSDKVPME